MPSKLHGIIATEGPTLLLGHAKGTVACRLAAHDAAITIGSRWPETCGHTIRPISADRVRLKAMGTSARRAFEANSSAPSGLGAWAELVTAHPGSGVSIPAAEAIVR